MDSPSKIDGETVRDTSETDSTGHPWRKILANVFPCACGGIDESCQRPFPGQYQMKREESLSDCECLLPRSFHENFSTGQDIHILQTKNKGHVGNIWDFNA